MGFFSEAIVGVKSRFKESMQKKKEDKAFLDRLRLEAQAEEKKQFEIKFRQDSFEVAKKRAFKDASEKSGLAKLQAMNRARRLEESGMQRPGFLNNLAQFTAGNRVRREENLKRTAMLREEAMKMRGKRMTSNQTKKPFSLNR